MSKSVSESRSAAAIGTRKRTRIAVRPGARNIQAARPSCGADRRPRLSRGVVRRGGSAATGPSLPLLLPGPRQDPAPLLEDPVDVRVDRLQCVGDGRAAPDRPLQILPELLRDL